MKLARPTSDTVLTEPAIPTGLELEIQALRQQSLERLAKMLADEWAESRENN